MSVYTPVSESELRAFLQGYDLGQLVEFQGILAGIENTNYFVTTTHGRYVLTLFEQLGWDELPYFLDLMAFLAEHGVPSAHPLADRDGDYLRTLNDRPAALVRRLEGRGVQDPNPTQCAALGTSLGHLHKRGRDFGSFRANQRGADWRMVTAERILPKLDVDSRQLLRHEMHYLKHVPAANLPVGVTHADLFRDNALFEQDRLMGIIDFYYACNDVLLYDVAVTVNDWCSTDDGALDEARLTALMAAYRAQRPLDAAEIQYWPYMLRAAATRFWLSRLQDFHFPRAGEMTHIKDPTVFERILRDRARNSPLLPG